MAVINPVSYLHNRTDHTAQTDRLATSSLILPEGVGVTWRQGVRGFTDYIVQAQGTPNMSVNIGAGQCFVNQSTAGNGAYVVTNDGPVQIFITAAHATLTRRDLIVVKVEDSFFTGVVDSGSLIVVNGTASGSPVDPVVTGNYLILARITVAPAVTSISNAAITDLRPKVAALGGIVPVNTTVERTALLAWRGRVVDNAETGFLERYNGTTWRALREVDDTGWLNMPFTSPWSGVGQYRVKDNIFYAKGSAGRSSGTSAAVVTFPAGARPTQTFNWMARVNGSSNIALAIPSSGAMVVGTVANTDTIYFDGIVFPVN
jgi:hypothetical protein